MNVMHDKQTLTLNLRSLGVHLGDVVLVRANLGAIGRIESKVKEDYLNAILDAVGTEGTVVTLAFSKSFFIKRDKSYIFNGKSKAITGAFANLMLKHPASRRSEHPTNSYVAIGKYAGDLVKDHGADSGAYDPVRKVMGLNGKMLLIGCVGSSPGFTTTHLAEVDLGLHKKVIFPWLTTVRYESNGVIKLFKRRDIGGCSSTFYRFYGHYVKEELLIQGYVGNAYSVLIDANQAYNVERSILAVKPKTSICENPSCLLCRARRWDNLFDLPMFFFRKILLYIQKKISK